MNNNSNAATNNNSLRALTIAAIGVVYGDIGTSPLYTLRECFEAEHLDVTQGNVYGFLSLIFWAILLVVTLKYVIFVMQADNKGEGGIVVLMQEARRFLRGKASWIVMMLGLIGAALFYGDAIITPAVSVLSAAEGLAVLNSSFEPFIIPIAMSVLFVLFLVQRFGTQSVGTLFGPIMVVWFICLALLGGIHIIENPTVFMAINPYYAVAFIANHGWSVFLGLGAVVLALTGAEALYADMGHFGKKPIRFAWFSLILPSLCLNYFGQGALLLSNPESIKNPFFLLAPSWGLLPLIILATIATVIASQAVISGAYSITRQLIQLSFSPRMKIVHTSAEEIGQIYVPTVNWSLLFAVLLVIGLFKSSTNLAAAYGIAVTATMVITSLLFFVVMVKNWRWPVWVAASLTGLFLCFDLVLFIANLLKLAHGGWLPVLIAVSILFMFLTWMKGRKIMNQQMVEKTIKLQDFIANLEAFPPQIVNGSAIFLNSEPDSVPPALLHNLKHNKILHERVAFLTVHTQDEAFVDSEQRLSLERLSEHFYRLDVYYGYQEIPDIKDILKLSQMKGLSFDLMDTSFFLSYESISSASSYKHMNGLRGAIFLWLNKNSARSTDFFQIPANRVVELGTQIEI
ncbi:potassium transporter Kup [Neisseria sp. Ec49-e6-T10]|uniref:potassium transporter Kup n=1 Tax=Neisseria sp. Ec49-e6-T10 TaxID=3140744 RepID=UPI003EBA12E9